MVQIKRAVEIGLLAVMLGGCGTMSGDEAETAEGKAQRYAVLSSQSAISVDPGMDAIAVQLPTPIENLSWPQRGANAANAVGALSVSGFSPSGSASIGEGEDWETVLATAPVIGGGVVYAMDAHGYISAHDAKDIDAVLWVSDAAAMDDEEILGGGLAVADEQLFVTTGQGDVMALDTKTGARSWQRNLMIPIRSAPKLHSGIVFVLSVDDQVYALDASTGAIRWQHRGLGERVGFLSAASPAVGENFLVVGYSSGELYGLADDTGQEIWNDSLVLARKTSATSVFTGFVGDPVMAGGVVFAASGNGLTAATHLLTGQRIWEQEISAVDTPWLAPNFLFLLTPDAQVVALHVRDGRIKWVSQLPRYDDPKDKDGLLRWHGPVMLNDQLVLTGEHGAMLALSPQTGEVVAEYAIPDGVRKPPVVADGTVYLMTGDAKLHTLR